MGERDVLFLDYTDDGTEFEVIPLGTKKEDNWFMAGPEDYPDIDDDMSEDEYVPIIRERENKRWSRNGIQEDHASVF
jgi:hypothetical protein